MLFEPRMVWEGAQGKQGLLCPSLPVVWRWPSPLWTSPDGSAARPDLRNHSPCLGPWQLHRGAFSAGAPKGSYVRRRKRRRKS